MAFMTSSAVPDHRAVTADWHAALRRQLKKTFGLRQLRDGQAAVIERVMAGRHTVAIMPTGAGKSLCYQLPALLLSGRTVVVSPLIALMKDQCDKLREMGVAAVQVNSALGVQESHLTEQALVDGSARIVFVTPERLADKAFLDILGRHPVSLLVVDEAHCVSQWGHDFRPAFLEIGPALRQLGRPVVLALTATATGDVIDDVTAQLGMKPVGVVHTGVYRDNLQLRVEHVRREDEKLARLLAMVQELQGDGLVYAATVRSVEAVYEALAAAGVSATRYHGRLPAAERRANQEAFMSGGARVMVATNAFGLGIDKADTRFVLHYQMPSGLDAYYQEAGRAGRDGQPAVCTLLYMPGDKSVQQFFMAGRYPALEDVDAVYRALLQGPAGQADWTADSLAARIGRPRAKLRVALALLRQQGVVTLTRGGNLRLRRADLDEASAEALLGAYRDKRERDRDMLERMVFYGQTGGCRWRVLLEHFGEEGGFERCHRCDNCLRLAAAQEQLASSPEPPATRPEPAPRPAFAVGSTVRVARYGLGMVTAADAHTVTVGFAKGVKRCFSAPYVQAA